MIERHHFFFLRGEELLRHVVFSLRSQTINPSVIIKSTDLGGRRHEQFPHSSPFSFNILLDYKTCLSKSMSSVMEGKEDGQRRKSLMKL